MIAIPAAAIHHLNDPSCTPLRPRLVAYSSELTEKRWRSWSELNAPRPSHVDAD